MKWTLDPFDPPGVGPDEGLGALKNIWDFAKH